MLDGSCCEGCVEVPFHEVRTPTWGLKHSGSDRIWLSCGRHLPYSDSLSFVALFAHQLLNKQKLPVRQAAWYVEALLTFTDTLAFVR